MRRTVLSTALTLLFAFSLSADVPLYTMSPASGPATGGTTVTINGPFGALPYTVFFDSAQGGSTMRLDDRTLQAVTPEHQPGLSRVLIFELDRFIDTGLRFEFTGQASREQYLVPVFIPPVQGAFGSEFRTELRGVNTSTDPNDTIDVWGLEASCRYTPPICNWLGEPMVFVTPGVDLMDYGARQTGTPGRFIEVPHEQKDDLSLNLRVYDTSRSAENFGTEIPIVRTSEFRTKAFALLGVPRDPRFRNTLRLYATGPTTVQLTIGTEVHHVSLPVGQHHFDPSYAMWTTFPTGTGALEVTVTPAENGPAVWGFITVTNNETQHITTITPH